MHDEVKNIKKDFLCNQKLLVEQMGYFAEVTMGQKLEDMEISVHCDVTIFEWLMRWVKRESVLDEDQPKLDVQCAVPVSVVVLGPLKKSFSFNFYLGVGVRSFPSNGTFVSRLSFLLSRKYERHIKNVYDNELFERHRSHEIGFDVHQ